MFLDKTQFEEWMRRIMERLDLLENRMNNRLEHNLNGCSATSSSRKRPEIDGERLLDNTDLCFMLNCSKRTLQRLRASGHLPTAASTRKPTTSPRRYATSSATTSNPQLERRGNRPAKRLPLKRKTEPRPKKLDKTFEGAALF